MNKGFSLVELIVVIAIMAILVGVAVPVYTSYIGKANESVDKTLVGEIEQAIEVVLIDPDVVNPESGATITLSKEGVLGITASKDTANKPNEAFLAKVKTIVDGSKLKSDLYSNGVTFEISGYECTVKKTPSN